MLSFSPMAARTSEEEHKRRRRKRLVHGLLLGGAAVGLPALLNTLISRRTRRLEVPVWGRSHRFAWTYGEVAFQLLGQGDPVLLLHSLGPGHDAEEWRSAGEILARQHRIYAPDLLGWGRSDKPALAYDGELYIQLVADFIRDVVRDRAVIAAAGLAAAYAVQVAVDEPGLVRALSLVVPSGIDLHGDEPDLGDALVHRLLRLPFLGTSALNLYTSRTAIGQHLRRQYGAAERVDAALAEHHYRSSHQAGGHKSLAAYLCGYLNHRVEDAVSRLTVPVLITWGREATAPPVESADLWLQRLPQAELEVLRGCSNLPHSELPSRFCQRLERFLDQTGT